MEFEDLDRALWRSYLENVHPSRKIADFRVIFSMHLVSDENTKQQLRRVRAAFDVGRWEDEAQGTFFTRLVEYDTSQFQCEIIGGEITTLFISIDLSEPSRDERLESPLDYPTATYLRDAGVNLSGMPFVNEIMARGLYCLGIEHDHMSYSQLQSYQGHYTYLTELPLLSAREKLELRLSMPREFWPQKWIDEEGTTGRVSPD